MAHRLLIGKGMITLNLKRIFLTLTLLPLFAVAADDCALSDPTLTVQAYTVNPQTERVKMYWQKANGEAWGTLHALLADMNSQVQMAMNGGIYDESYAPLGLYIENGQQKVALNLASGEGNFFIRPGGVFYVAGDKVGIVRLDAFKTSKEIQFAVQSGPMLMENSVINPRIHPNVASRKFVTVLGLINMGMPCFC
ncbi:protein [Escherichia coli]|nr:protein [Escherichia coli]